MVLEIMHHLEKKSPKKCSRMGLHRSFSFRLLWESSKLLRPLFFIFRPRLCGKDDDDDEATARKGRRRNVIRERERKKDISSSLPSLPPSRLRLQALFNLLFARPLALFSPLLPPEREEEEASTIRHRSCQPTNRPSFPPSLSLSALRFCEGWMAREEKEGREGARAIKLVFSHFFPRARFAKG